MRPLDRQSQREAYHSTHEARKDVSRGAKGQRVVLNCRATKHTYMTLKKATVIRVDMMLPAREMYASF